MSTEANKVLIRKYYDELNRKSFAAYEELVAPAVTYNGAAVGRDGMLQFSLLLRTAFPDLRVMVEEMVAEGDWRGFRTQMVQIWPKNPTFFPHHDPFPRLGMIQRASDLWPRFDASCVRLFVSSRCRRAVHYRENHTVSVGRTAGLHVRQGAPRVHQQELQLAQQHGNYTQSLTRRVASPPAAPAPYLSFEYGWCEK